MGLFGGNRRDLNRAMTFFLSGRDGLERQRQAEAARGQQFVADRLRSDLSPVDGPNGSGTGAMPSIEQQMSALDNARLLNPEVANQFAPAVQSRRMEQMTASLPPEQRMAIMLNPEQAGASYASQFKDETLSSGSIRTRGGQALVGAPVVNRYDDRPGVTDPITGRTTYGEPRGATYAEETQRLTAERPQITSLSPNQQAFGVGPQGQVQPLAQNTVAPPPNPAQVELQGSIDTNQREVIPTLTQMRQMLQSGDVITGFGADARLQALRLAASGGNQDAQRQVAATEAYRNMSGRLRVGMAKTLGANPSNADIQLLEQITAGNIGQNREALLATLDQGLTFAQQRAADLQRQAGQGRPQAQGAPQGQGGPRPRARNPQTRQVVEYNGSQWVPVQ